jgi:ABC-type sugar transport system substrate-binding protein
MNRSALRLLVGLLFALAAIPAWAFSVVFLNPGKSDEKFWVSVSSFMQAAAADLKVDLEVIYAERDPARMVANANAVLARKTHPDYLIVVNEKLVGGEILRLTAGTGIKVFFLLNTLNLQQRNALTDQGVSTAHVVGSLIPNNDDAGYEMAKALIAEAKKRRLVAPSQNKIQMLAIAGDKSTPASLEREAGLRRALAEHPEVELAQTVYGEWNQQRAREQSDVLLQRFPRARLIWAANDLMAFGAMQATEARGLQPGRDVLLSGLNNSPEAMQARIDGRLSILVAGHFTAGGWALVMLHDHHAGKSLARAGGAHRNDRLFIPLDAQQAARFLEIFNSASPRDLDFRSFSLVHNRKLSRYDFSLLRLLH